MGKILNREALRVVTRNDRGAVNYRKRYRRGDEVDTSKMQDTQVEALVKSGALVDSEDDLSDPASATGASPASGPYGAATAASGDTPDTPDEQTAPVTEGAEESYNPDDAADGSSPNTEGGADDVEDVDQYSEMDYGTLRSTASKRDLDTSGNTEDLRTRLREADASS